MCIADNQEYKDSQLFMDRNSGKRGATGSLAPRKASKVGVKDATASKDQSVQFCNRIGCQGRIKYSNQNAKIGSSDKAKCSRPSFSSSNRNETVGNSSRNGCLMTKAKRLSLDSKRKLASQSKFDPSESSQSSHDSRSTSTSREAKFGTSSIPSSIKPRKNVQHKQGSNMQNTLAASSISNSPGLGTLNSSNKSRCLKNLKCSTSLSDVVPSNCSSSGSKSAAKNVMKKRNPEAESSLSRRGRNTTATSSNGVSVSASRRSCWTNAEDSSGASSVRTRRSTYVNQNRTGLSYRQNGRNTLFGREPSSRTSYRFPGSGPPTRVGSSSLLQQSANASSSGWSSYSTSISNDENQSPFASADLGFGHLMNRRDALHRYNMDGMSEVLFVLRIEFHLSWFV